MCSELHFIRVCLRLDSPQLAEKYGNVFSVRFGSDTSVFVTSYKMVKEALVTQAENFVDRPHSSMATRFYQGPTSIGPSSVLSHILL